MLAAWSLLTTAPNSELRVSHRLRQLNLPHILFKRRITTFFRGKKVERLVAAFPRYIFVLLNNSWNKIASLGIVGMTGLVHFGESIAKLSWDVVETLLGRADNNHVLPLPVKPSRFQFGQKVIVTGHGLIAGYQAIFQYLLDDGKACVLQHWLGALRPVSVSEEELVALSDKRKQRGRRRSRHRYRLAPSPSYIRA